MSISKCGIILSSHTGLGNRLFKVAFIYSYAKKHNKQFGYIENHLNLHSKINYFETIYPFLQKIDTDSQNTLLYNEEDHQCISYVHIPNYLQDVIFNGYFQCDKYFREFKKEIQQLFLLPSTPIIPSENSIFLHVRRGDYLYSPNHYIDLTLYYIKCLQFLKKEKGDFDLYVVSDDIQYCKNELSKVLNNFVRNVVYVDGLNELETMSLMRECKMGGICANSSFSWWGAYLNPNEDKMIFFPSQWFKNPKYQEWCNEIAFQGSFVVDMKTYEINEII
jgi:hypothetical protein